MSQIGQETVGVVARGRLRQGGEKRSKARSYVPCFIGQDGKIERFSARCPPFSPTHNKPDGPVAFPLVRNSRPTLLGGSEASGIFATSIFTTGFGSFGNWTTDRLTVIAERCSKRSTRWVIILRNFLRMILRTICGFEIC